MDTADRIEIVATAIPGPLMLAKPEFLATLKTVEDQIASLKIVDAHTAQEAATLTTRLTSAGKALNQQRLALNKPYAEMQDRINEAARAPLARIEAAKGTLSRLQTAFTLECQRLARIEEQKRQDELRKLEEQRIAEAKIEADRVAALQKLADEAAALAANRKGPRTLEDFDAPELPEPEPVQPTETEQAIARLQSAPVRAVPRPSGVRLVVKLVATVVDVNMLADIFVTKTPKLAAIQTTYCSGWREGQPMPVCNGVRFEVKSETQSTGRAGF